MTFQPAHNLDFSMVNITLPPGSTLQQTEAVVDRVAKIVRPDPNVASVYERINVASGRVIVVLKKERDKTSTEFERSYASTMAAVPDARVSFQSQGGGGPDAGRDIMLYLGGDDPVKLLAAANKIADEMQTIPGLRAPRVGGDLVRPEIVDQAAPGPRRGPRRHDGGAEPDDPHRNAWRYRAEQRQILALRSPGADHRVAVRKLAARHRDAREPAGADVERRLGAAESRRRDRLRLRVRRRSSAPTRSAASRSAPTLRPAW